MPYGVSEGLRIPNLCTGECHWQCACDGKIHKNHDTAWLRLSAQNPQRILTRALGVTLDTCIAYTCATGCCECFLHHFWLGGPGLDDSRAYADLLCSTIYFFTLFLFSLKNRYLPRYQVLELSEFFNDRHERSCDEAFRVFAKHHQWKADDTKTAHHRNTVVSGVP